ncbi:hypothetical protein M0805_006868 [Coniferiporia weirii]|nr:hypothetical protein M0805_006868 [Coniferiporia weirii]
MKETQHDARSSLAWRSLYTEVALVWSMRDCLVGQPASSPSDESFWKEAIARLDFAIVIAGAPGEGRLDLILDSIERIQKTCMYARDMTHSTQTQASISEKINFVHTRPPLHSASQSIICLERAPSLAMFLTTLRHTPFILRGFADDWPAVTGKLWESKLYLQHVAGKGRVIPVEVGRDYRTDDWTQRMMDWDEFLDYLYLDTSAGADSETEKQETKEKEILYHAQHDIFRQFPALRNDIVIPDYVYSTLPPPDHYPQYRPPANEDALVLNAWFGPEGTISPAHTDPYYNFYVQVVGQKTVWIAPPRVSHALSPNSEPVQTRPLSSSRSQSPDCKHKSADAVLGNTSRIDVFSLLDSDSSENCNSASLVREVIAPAAMCATLCPGDMLFFPPGWWHAMRSESVSFSVSMWF